MTASRPARAAEFARYLRTETTGGIILLAATAVALIWANSPAGDVYRAVRDFHVGPEFLHLNLSIGDWAKDGLLALFFFVAGLELKRELVVGELSRVKQAVLPVIAAVGGMVVPALIALAVAWGTPGIDRAWAIPVATDIAFALGVLALTASNLPSSARVFLLSLAVVDDLGAILVIAIVFTTGFDLVAAAVAVVALALYWFLQHKRVRTAWLYVPLAVVTWVAVHSTGIHATIAGVALGLLTRVKPDEGEDEAPAVRLEHRLQPWSAAVAVPVFALFAAGISVSGHALGQVFTTALPLAVLLGLVVGKFVGILGASVLAVKLGVAEKPTGTGWRDLSALALLGGVGFTVSLLIADLALDEPETELAKAAVLIASAIASLASAALLVRRSRAHARGSIPTLPTVRRAQGTGTWHDDPVTSPKHERTGPDGVGAVPYLPLSSDEEAAAAEQSIGKLVGDATQHLSTLVRAEVELAKSELVGEMKKGLKGAVFFLIALAVGLYSSYFLFLFIAEILSDWWGIRWPAFLTVFGLMLLTTAITAFLGWRKVKKLKAPERTIDSVKETAAALKPRRAAEDDLPATRP